MKLLPLVFVAILYFCLPAVSFGQGSRGLRPLPTPDRAAIALERLRSLQIKEVKIDPYGNPKIRGALDRLYAKPSSEQLQYLAVEKALLDANAAFLRQPETGIFKLNADSDCGSVASDIVVASGNCLLYQFPGGGTAYSFRTGSHRLARLADLVLSDGVFKSDGVFQQAIMVDLGDVPIAEVTLQTSGLRYLNDFKPALNIDQFRAVDEQLTSGIKADGFLYRLGFYASEGTTFAIRSIAYKSQYLRTIEGVTYNELDLDKRKDVLVAFRVIGKEPTGNIIVLWRMLKTADAPKLELFPESKASKPQTTNSRIN